MKRRVFFTAVATAIISVCMAGSAFEADAEAELLAGIDPAIEEAYRNYSTTAEEMGKFVTVSLETFVDGYDVLLDNTVDSYLDMHIAELEAAQDITEVEKMQAEIREQAIELEKATISDNVIAPANSTLQWWHNKTDLPRAVTYGTRYNLLTNAKQGDLVYEAAGGFGVTGHTAIVEGTFYSSRYSQYYVRCIEAVITGVTYGILCDERFTSQKSYLDRPTGANTTQKRNALTFAAAQVGKSYFVNPSHSISYDRSNWYCSFLAYASYLSHGVSICQAPPFNEILMPATIHYGNVSTIVSY